MDKKVSVIMASYLGQFINSASNREQKFIRAVKSFLNQSYPNKQLIISADGCMRTYELYKELWGNNPEIECIIMDKQPTYSGNVRNEAIKLATGDIITFLDNDDVIGKDHLKIIVEQFTDDVDWVYYNDYLVLSPDFKKLQMREVETRYGSIGTSSLTCRNTEKIRNAGLYSDGYGHDFLAMMKLASMGLKFKKLEKTPLYLVCHWGDMTKGGGDF